MKTRHRPVVSLPLYHASVPVYAHDRVESLAYTHDGAWYRFIIRLIDGNTRHVGPTLDLSVDAALASVSITSS